MPEWTPYRLTLPTSATARAYHELKTVHHVVHVPGARRILEDDRIRAGLIYDESRLNKSRTCVAWVSANTWGPGSIYGNVQFSFSWRDIIRGRQLYWVEAIKYSPHAYRLLVTNRDLSNSRHVTPYDPRTDKGPVVRQGGRWYWNGDYTSEFMVDSDLELADCTGFSFIRHRPDRCRLYQSGCKDRNAPTYRIGGRVLAFLLGNSLHSVDSQLKAANAFRPEQPLSDAVDTGVDGILRVLGKADNFGGALVRPLSAEAALMGALALYGSDQRKAALELVGMLKSNSVFEKALVNIIEKHFGVNGWSLPEN
ncbi:hypothetical protein ACVW1C_002322 [Bradyrhizobium sp. USDA 4011]